MISGPLLQKLSLNGPLYILVEYPCSTVKNLGVILDSNLSLKNHISHVTKTAFFHLRSISKLRNMLSVSDAEKLVHSAFMTSRLRLW